MNNDVQTPFEKTIKTGDYLFSRAEDRMKQAEGLEQQGAEDIIRRAEDVSHNNPSGTLGTLIHRLFAPNLGVRTQYTPRQGLFCLTYIKDHLLKCLERLQDELVTEIGE